MCKFLSLLSDYHHLTHFTLTGDSPLPDLSVLDEIPQDDWEQMLSGSNTSKGQEVLSDVLSPCSSPNVLLFYFIYLPVTLFSLFSVLL